MKTSSKLAFALCAAVAIGRLTAAVLSYDGGEGGDFADGTIWNGGNAPSDGDTVSLQSWKTAEVGFYLSADYSTELNPVSFGAPLANAHLWFDGMGYNFAPKTSVNGTYSANVFQIFGPKGHTYLAVTKPTDPNRAPYVFSNPRFDLYKLDEGSGLAEFSRGTFDFGLDSGEIMELGAWEPSGEFRFSGSSSLKIGKIHTKFIGQSTDNGSYLDDVVYKLSFVGGEHEVGHLVYGNSERRWNADHTIVVSNSVLNVSKFEMAPYGKATFVTGPGGVLNVGSGGLGITNALTYAATNIVSINQGTWNLNGSGNVFGSTRSTVATSILASESTVNNNSGNLKVQGGNTVMEFTNSKLNSAQVTTEYGAQMKFVGGSINVATMNLAQYGSSSLMLDGGEHVIEYLFFGNTPSEGSFATLTLKAGRLDVSRGIGVNPHYRACVNVLGGTLVTPNWNVAYGSGNDEDLTENNIACMSGGLVRVNGTVKVGASQNRHGVFMLDGGMLETSEIWSPDGLKTGNKTASADLRADGGTLCAYRNRDSDNEGILSYFDNVEIGEKGLTIDTAGYDVRFRYNRSVRNKAGASGVIRKTGEGSLKFLLGDGNSYGYRGTYDVSTTLVEEGSLVMMDENTTLNTSMRIENGSNLSLEGSAKTLYLDSLVVTNGLVVLDPGDLITVSGTVSFNRLKLSLTSPIEPDSGTVELLRVSGEMDEASRREWSDAIYGAVVADGCHAEFSSEYNSGSGYTSLKVSVSENTPMTDSTTWVGTDSDWSKPANWSKGLPESNKIAIFTDNGAVKEVTVSSGACAGALDFKCGGYVLSGESIAMKTLGDPLRIKADAGESVIKVRIEAFSALNVDVYSEALIDLHGKLSFNNYHAFTKNGDGNLTLRTSGNEIFGDVCLNAGLLEAYGATNAFGAARTTSKIYLAQAGRLKLHGCLVEVPVDIAGNNNKDQLVFAAGTTNVLVEMRNDKRNETDLALRFTVEDDAVATCHDWRSRFTTQKYGNGTCVLDGILWQDVFCTVEGITSAAVTKSCRPSNNSLDSTDNVQTSLRMDGGVTRIDSDTFHYDWNKVTYHGSNGILDLNGHDVEFGGIQLNGTFARMTSASPARFTHRGNAALSPLTGFDIEGMVTFVFNANGMALSIDAPMSSMGGVAVTNGTLTMTSNASWQNPTNATVFVGGNGRLVVSKSGTFSKKMNFDLRENGVLDLSSGARQSCAELYLDGSAEPAALGTWGASGSGAQHINDVHFAGTGVLDVRGTAPRGMRLIVR